MQSPIGRVLPAAGRAIAGRAGRIGGDAGNLTLFQHQVGFGREPACMTRLAGEDRFGLPPQIVQERRRDIAVIGEAGRQLHQQHAKFVAQAGNFFHEA